LKPLSTRFGDRTNSGLQPEWYSCVAARAVREIKLRRLRLENSRHFTESSNVAARLRPDIPAWLTSA
jgi:hypothetical protein